jgi:hypothetical protein
MRAISLRLSISIALLAAAPLVACGGDDASAPDAGASDAQPRVDSATPVDASAPNDAGVDGSRPADAAMPIDAKPPSDATPPTDATPPSDATPPIDGGVVANGSTAKVDLLFMIDNSSSMGDKQSVLAANVPDVIGRFVNPNCVDAANPTTVLGVSSAGVCAQGVLEFKPIVDLHIAIVSSSLGGRGSDLCASPAPNPVNPALDRHNDDQGHLLNRAGDNEVALGDASPSSFLAWFPPSATNAGQPAPTVPALSATSELFSDFASMVGGVHQYGCGFEAQLESWYRFLIQPDPYASIAVSGGRASYVSVDATILQQRHDFLRPDSLVAVVVLTDENDSTVDPMALGGQGWAFENSMFPGSTTGGAPKSTAACLTNPNDPTCDSCAFHTANPECNPEFYGLADDSLNVRFFHMKERFGVDPQFPISRYVRALSQTSVPDRDHEHLAGSATYTGDTNANCTNPLFAATLPTDPTGNLCALTPGTRSPSNVFFLTITGVPHQLLQVNPADPNSAQKATLSAADWNAVLGADPLNYDFTGVDPHMLESETARPGLPGPGAADNADPINGRDWNTNQMDLEYACVFDLPAPKDCTLTQNMYACDCESGYLGPLCQSQGSTLQTRAKAYPAIRELAVARALGAQGVVSSICPIHTTEAAAGDPLFGYRPAIGALVTQMSAVLPK